MANPWTAINPFNPKYGSGKYVLNGDETFVDKYNNVYPNDLQLQLMPEPFIGNFCNSKLMILMGNPGYSQNAKLSKKGIVLQDSEDDWHKEKAFLDVIQSSWDHKKSFYYYSIYRNQMNGLLKNQSLDWNRNPGYKYWQTKLNQLFTNLHVCPNEVFEAELFPYHSINLRLLTPFLNNITNWKLFVSMSSTQYLIDLITAAMVCDKIIIIARSRELYFKLCPALKNYPHLYVLKSFKGVHFTEKTIKNYQLYQNGKSTIEDIEIMRNYLQSTPECCLEFCKKIVLELSQSN